MGGHPAQGGAMESMDAEVTRGFRDFAAIFVESYGESKLVGGLVAINFIFPEILVANHPK